MRGPVFLLLALALPALTACIRSAMPSTGMAARPATTALLRSTVPDASVSKAYWTLFNAKRNPQVEIATLPLKRSPQVTDVNGNATNQLVCANAMRFHGGHLWIMNLNPCRGSGSSILQVYSLPLTSESVPKAAFVLSGPLDADHMTFDAKGHLWVSSIGNNTVYEYTGPFTSSGTLSPTKTLTLGLNLPQGLGFDVQGKLYVANGGSTDGQKAIAVFNAPIKNRRPYFLRGVIAPSGLAFDRNGNLYVTYNGTTTGAIALYGSMHLRAGNRPTLFDLMGIANNAYGADLNFDKAGNLYDADCGATPGIYSYATARKKFSPNLVPSFYSNDAISSIGCVWGIALH
jgi:hypothetical protein